MRVTKLKTLLFSLSVLPVAIVMMGALSCLPGQTETKVKIRTTKGDLVVKLYNETPKTRDNFIKLVNSKFYDSTLFHRVIPGFMIQAGDPNSKHAAPNAMLGNGDIGYTVPAEFNPKLIHKKGALACARQGDEVDPTKASSGCQFYIAQGKVYTDDELNQMQDQRNSGIKQQMFTKIISRPENAALKQKFIECQQKNNIDSLRIMASKLEPEIDSLYSKAPKFTFSPEQRKAYTTVGGVPHLDGNYTVFGEVIEGLNIIDSIAAVKTNQYDRPKEDVRILSMEIVK